MHRCFCPCLTVLLALTATSASRPSRAVEPAKPQVRAPQASAPAAAAVSHPKLDASLPYQAEKSNPVTYDVDFSVVVTPPYHAKQLKVWLPLPQSDVGQEVTEVKLSAFPLEVKPQINAEPEFGNRFAYLEFDHPEGAQIIRHQFKIRVWELHWNVKPANVIAVKTWPDSFSNDLKSDKSVVVDQRFEDLVHEIVPQSQGESLDLQQVFKWVNSTMKYDHDRASLQASSEHALLQKAGHCSDYHGFCAALGRAMHYPTRVTYGINPAPKNSPSHCKLEAFLPPYGWVSFDVSETQLLCAKIGQDKTLTDDKKTALIVAATERLAGGFRDNTWFLQTRGTDYELAPPASKRVNVVRTAYIEADGKPLADPDPADSTKREFSWMTVHKYTPDHPVKNPFKEPAMLTVKSP